MGVAATAAVTASTLLVSPAVAAPVPINQAALTERVFGQVVEVHITGAELIKTAVLSAEFVEWRRLHQGATAAQALAQLTARKQLLDSSLTAVDLRAPEQDLLLRSIDILLGTPGGETRTAPQISALVAAVIGRAVEPWDTREELASGALRTAQWMRGRDDALAGVWSLVRRQFASRPTYAGAWNTVLGAPFGVDVTSTYAQLKADPGLSQVDLDAVVALQGDSVAFMAAAKEQIAGLHAQLLDLSVTVRVELGQNNTRCPPEGPPSSACTEAAKRAAEARDKDRQEIISKAKAGIGALSTLVGFVDPQAAKKVKVIGEAVATTVSAISKYAAAVTGRGLVGALFSGATLTMTGNVFGAVMSIVGLFGSSGPSLDQQILQQVAALRNEVRALGEEMRASFARVEAQINTVYANMMAQFDRLNEAIAGNTAQLTAVQQQIAQLGLRLEDIAATVLAAIGDATLHDARADINQYIGYQENFGRTIPTYNEFLGPENEFHLVSTVLAEGAAFVVPMDQAEDPAIDPTTVLNSFGEARAINYLAKWANLRDSSMPDPGTPVGNPTVWNLGAQAYSMLALQNPGYAAQVSAARPAGIETEGTRILNTAASFARPNNGGVNNLFQSLMTDYTYATNELSTALLNYRRNEIQMRWEPDSNGVQQKILKTYDLFWDQGRTLAGAPVPTDPAQVPACTGTGQIDRPNNVSYGQMSNPVRLVNYAYAPGMGAGALPQLSTCYTPSWFTTRTQESGGILRTYGKLVLTIHNRFRINSGAAWQNSRTASYRWSDEQAIATHCESFQCDWRKSPAEGLAEKWPRDRGVFASGATITNNAALDTEVTTTLRGFLQTRQKAMYDGVKTAINTPSSPVQAAVKKMNTAARLLQAYTRMGMPLALDSDDVLSATLFGQYQIPVNMPTDTKIANAYTVASGNYTCGTAPCAPDASRPLRNQVNLKVPCEATGGANLPGDPLGDCLVASARSRINALDARYEDWAQRMGASTHREYLPWVNDTLIGLRITNRLVHTG